MKRAATSSLVGEFGLAVDRDVVVVVDPAEVVELEVAGDRGRLRWRRPPSGSRRRRSRRRRSRRARRRSGPPCHFEAIAIPTEVAIPWPSGPVVVSTPEVQRYSGWPGARESSWRNSSMSSSETDGRLRAPRSRGRRPAPRRGRAASRAASRRGPPRARSGRGWARSGRPGRSAGSAARACRRPAPSPSACPGCPEFAFWIASIESVRIVLMQSWSMSSAMSNHRSRGRS